MLLTVLMPVYNSENYLELAISSILNQTFKDFEFLIIDDGSCDSSAQIISNFTDERIRFVQNECNIGLIDTLNKGIDLAKGDYIARMDSDDISSIDRLEIQMKYLLTHPNVDLCAASYLSFSKKMVRKQYFPLNYDLIKAEALFNSPLSHPLVIAKKRIFKQYKYINDFPYAEDYALWVSMLKGGVRIVNLPFFLLKYRILDTSQTAIGQSYTKQRFQIISRIQSMALESVCVHNDAYYALLHYYMSYTPYIRKMDLRKYTIKQICDYLNKIVAGNMQSCYCSSKALKMVLGKIVLKILYYRWKDLRAKDIRLLLKQEFLWWGGAYTCMQYVRYKYAMWFCR